MRITTYTEYTLRVLIYLTLRYKSGEKATIQEIADSYEISRNHLMKIVGDLSRHGIIDTSRGRAGGMWLARPPKDVTVGQVVRLMEPDLYIVPCHEAGKEHSCAAWRACNMTSGFSRALAAFMRELDDMTLEDAVSPPRPSASVLGLGADGRRVIPIVPASADAISVGRRGRLAPAASMPIGRTARKPLRARATKRT